MTVNLTVRLKNKAFWITFIPALLLLIQTVGNMFGFQLDLTEVGDKILQIVNAVFLLLTILGIVNDPTTAGYSDSTNAMNYTRPKES